MLIPGDESHGRPAEWTDAPVTFVDNVPRYSVNIEYAWEVVEKLLELGWWPDIVSTGVPSRGAVPHWYCRLDHAGDDGPIVGPVEATAPLAVCRAALKALASLPEQPSPTETKP